MLTFWQQCCIHSELPRDSMIEQGGNYISQSFTAYRINRSCLVWSCRWDVRESADPCHPTWHRPSGFGAAGPVRLHSRNCGRGRQCAGRNMVKLDFLFIWSQFITSHRAQVDTKHSQCVFIWNCSLPRRYSQQPACYSSMGCGMPAVSSCSASWTLPTAWASGDSLTRTPAATCSSRRTSMSCSTLWRCPRQRSSCCCRWNR